ncbi:phosphopantetheine-binding protein [Lentzea sp. NPDC058436]|uniref:phosphopantetheine-binding protein n=1 Tax=Lentzea sp. NPDC058436 TaxID=3346499 RepID=UPI00364BB2A1
MNESARDALRDRIAALSDDQVARAVAMLGGQRSADQVLVGYVVAETGHELDGDDVRGRLVDVLPLTSIPARVVVLDAVPRTAGGKEDQRRLGELCRPSTEQAVPGSGDPVEDVVNAVWRRELGLLDDSELVDFFRAGGTSIGAIRTLTVLNAELGVDLPLVTMFRYPRPDLFAARIREHADSGSVLARADTALRRLHETRR